MTLQEIYDNVERLDDIEHEKLVDYVNELIFNIKRKESKIISLRTELNFYDRQLDKIQKLINNVIHSNKYKGDVKWNNK